MEDLETTMSKEVFLPLLEKKLAALVRERDKKNGAYQTAMRKYIAHTARVLREAAREIASGKLAPNNEGRWCRVRSKIEGRIGDPPDSLYDLNKQIAAYTAVVTQVKYHRGDPMRVSTSQVAKWLGGETVGR
jgi:hypothetical protein